MLLIYQYLGVHSLFLLFFPSSLHYSSSGWLQDRSGKWVKDENAEFDSDEEEPALLPPCSDSS